MVIYINYILLFLVGWHFIIIYIRHRFTPFRVGLRRAPLCSTSLRFRTNTPVTIVPLRAPPSSNST